MNCNCLSPLQNYAIIPKLNYINNNNSIKHNKFNKQLDNSGN